MIKAITSSLQKKFIIIAFLSVLFLTVTVSFFAVTATRTALYNATEQKGKLLAQTVSALIVNELIYEQLGLVEEGGLIDNYVRELRGQQELNLLYVAVLDTNFRVISHSDFSEYGKYYRDPFLAERQRQDTAQVRRTGGSESAVEAMEFAIPLSIEGKRWGVLLFSLSLAGVEKEASVILYKILLLTLFALGLLFGLIFFLSERFIRPIIDMSAAMSEVEVGMIEKNVPVKGEDELSLLAESYNQMVRRIRLTNEEMKVAHEKLLQSEKLAMLGVLSSSVAHRINNPLGGLFNCVRLLQRRGDDADFRKNYLLLIEEALRSIEETVGQLLWTAGKKEGEKKRSDVSAVLAGVVRFLDYRMRKQNIDYIEEISSGLTVAVAPHDLQEILLSTMINSIQAMVSEGRLTVTAGKRNTGVTIKVEDTGVGIAEDKLEKVFDLFYSTKEAGEGTGLGMWMTYELVAKYNGTIELQSKEGVGTVVSITIPEII